ncbi:hypothetical protein JCM10908_005103 [Rhodotorula pacifica]|uniref:uncharacterized protein n=1 Tax=Rhodotorula pacifica TaxID=1495444 RepID=UPI0031705AB2
MLSALYSSSGICDEEDKARGSSASVAPPPLILCIVLCLVHISFSAMKWLDTVKARLGSDPKRPVTFSSAGIEGKTTGEVLAGQRAGYGGLPSSEGQAAAGKKFSLRQQDCDSTLGKALRGLEVFFPFINLCILIAQAAFQSRWKVGLSARVILSLLVCLLGLAYSGLVLASFVLADNWRFLRGLERFFKQIPFFWLTLVACSSTLAICLITFARVRRVPQTGAFVPPSEQEAGAHFPRDADDDTWGGRASYDASAAAAGAAMGTTASSSAPAGYRPSHDFSNDGERLFAGQAPGYGVRDPFEDQEQSDGDDTGRAKYQAVTDPYEMIRQSMDRPSPQRY